MQKIMFITIDKEKKNNPWEGDVMENCDFDFLNDSYRQYQNKTKQNDRMNNSIKSKVFFHFHSALEQFKW